MPEPLSSPSDARLTVPAARIAAVVSSEARRTNLLFLENTNTRNKAILAGVTTALAVGAVFFLTRNVSSAMNIRYIAVAALLAGCGARTGLEIPHSESALDASVAQDVSSVDQVNMEVCRDNIPLGYSQFCTLPPPVISILENGDRLTEGVRLYIRMTQRGNGYVPAISIGRMQHSCEEISRENAGRVRPDCFDEYQASQTAVINLNEAQIAQLQAGQVVGIIDPTPFTLMTESLCYSLYGVSFDNRYYCCDWNSNPASMSSSCVIPTALGNTYTVNLR